MSGNDTEEPMDWSDENDVQQPSTFLKSTEWSVGNDVHQPSTFLKSTEALMTSSKKKDEEVQVTLSLKWSKGVQPQKYKSELQKVLQSLFKNNKEFNGDCKVLDAKDGSAVVHLKPASAASELQKLCGQTLTNKDKDKAVTILSVSLTPLETQVPEDAPMNLPPSYVSEPQDNKDEVQVTLSVKWSEGVQPQKYRSELQKLLQIWFNNNKEFKGKCNVINAKDGSAVVHLKPALAASELQKLSGQTLTNKDKKVVTILSVSVTPSETQVPEDAPMNLPPSYVSEPQDNKDEVQVTLSVKWSEGVQPQKYRSELQKLLQIWFNNNKEFKGKCNVINAKDGSAVVHLKPALAASELQKLSGQTLTYKDKKVVTILSVSVTPSETQVPEDAPMNLPPSYVSEPQDEQVQLGEQSSAASTEGEETCSVPVGHFWYMNHIYKEEMNRIVKDNGVKMEAEVKVTFQADRKDAGPQKALNEFINLVQKSLGESDGSPIPLKNVDPEEWKDVLKIAQTKENKLLLTVSSEEMTVCGPMQSQDAIKKSLSAAISTSTSVGESTWASQDTKLNTSIKDPLVSTGLTMEESYWKLMTTSFSEQPLMTPSKNKDEVQVTLSVKWSEGVQLQKSKTELEKVLQSWANNNKEFDGDCTVLSVSEDGSAVVHFKPAPAVCVLQKLCGQTLTKKDKKVVTILSVSLTPPETQVPEDAPMNLPPSYVSEPQDEQVQLGEQSSAASTAGEETCFVPVGLFWYVNHIYKEEMNRIVKENGVKMEAEVKVTFQADRKDAGPQKALNEFISLVQKCLGESDGPPIPLKNLDPEEWKNVLKIAQTKENKLLLTVSSEEMTACGPMQSQDAIKKSLHAAISTSTSVGESTSASQDTMLNIGTNIKDPLVSTGLTMEESYWKLMTTSFSEQVAKIKTKFGVDFKESGVSQGKVKVKACYKSSGGNASMESHAVRALLHLYQKTATVKMPSKSP